MTPDYRNADWQRARQYAQEATHFELNGARIVVSVLLPVAASFYSPWAAGLLAVPCAVAAGWYTRRAVRQFIKREDSAPLGPRQSR